MCAMNVLRRWVVVASALLCLVATATLTGAEEPRRRGKWWQAEEVRRELALTAEQSSRIEQIFQATLPELSAAKNSLDELQSELSRLLGDQATDEGLVARQIDRVEAARSELSKRRTLMLFRMNRILSPDQRNKLKALHDRGDGRRNGDNPGRKPTE